MTALPGARPRPIRRPIRTAIIAAGMVVLAYASLRTGIGIAAAAGDPALSLAWSPGNAWALRRLAEDRLQGDRAPAGIAAAARDARAALARQILEPAALRTLGLARALGGEPSKGEAPLLLAERMSRRDAKTQIWFAGRALAAGDIDGTLRHYDIALRTSADARPLLYPILCRALTDPEAGSKVARLLVPAPNWSDEFVNACADMAAARHALALALTHAPRALDRAGFPAKAKLVAGLAHDRDYAAAHALFRAVPHDQALPPFDWSVASQADFLAAPVEQGGLYVLADADRSGTLATRLLLLPAGSHRLTVASGDPATANGLQWTLACDGGAPIALLEAAGGPFAVPRACAAQWLTLTARAGWPRRREGVLGRIAIDPARPGA